MGRRWQYSLVILSLLLGMGCHKQPAPQPVVVRVFRDLHSPYGHELDHRILEYQLTNPRLASGAPVVVKTFDDMDYETALKSRFDRDLSVDVVILNAATDANGNPPLTADLAHATDICAAVKACPANSEAQNNLAWRLVRSPGPPAYEPAEVVALVQKAVAAAPDATHIRHTLGVAHYRAGDYARAMETLHQSAEGYGGNLLAQHGFFLAMAHWHLT